MLDALILVFGGMLAKWSGLAFIQKANVLIAVVGVGVAGGAINRMSRQTECTIIFAFSTVAAGLVGYALGAVLPDRWEAACDTLLLGGIVALVAGSRKQTIWIAPQWMPKISAGISAATWFLFLGGIA